MTHRLPSVPLSAPVALAPIGAADLSRTRLGVKGERGAGILSPKIQIARATRKKK